MMKQIFSDRGFTLIEVMVAAAILGIGCLGVLAMMITAISFNQDAHDRTEATTLAERDLAFLETLSISKLNWNTGPLKALNDSNNWNAFDHTAGERYHVFIRRHGNIIDSGDSQLVYGAIRVAWNCDAAAPAALDSLATIGNCKIVTLPFTLTKPNK